MSLFLRLLNENDKAKTLRELCSYLRSGITDTRVFEVDPEVFVAVPGKPFAYWVSEAVRQTFSRLPTFGSGARTVKQGLATADDFRFVRACWEVSSEKRWFGFAKGGKFSPFYADIHLVVNWEHAGAEIKHFSDIETGKIRSRPQSTEYYFRPGVTWSLATTLKLSARALPSGCIISVIGPGVFVDEDIPEKLLATSSIMNSKAYIYLLEMQLGLAAEGRRAYQVGTINDVPFPSEGAQQNESTLSNYAFNYWSKKREIDSIDESSHAFLVPEAIRPRLGRPNTESLDLEIKIIQEKIDDIAFRLYGFGEIDRLSALGAFGSEMETLPNTRIDSEDDSEEENSVITEKDGLLSWAVGVAFGRFDWRLATGEREAPPEPEPFDPLPAKSPGMLPDGAEPFHTHAGILVDDPGHPHDLARLIEEVLARVEVPVPEDVRRWLRRDFFACHLQRYSKSRRKAPIYWPLSTTSGSYTLWVYYPSLTSQTLYSAINDFVEPRLKQVGADVAALRNKGSARSRDDEKQFEALQAFELELTELRETMLRLAPTYKPNHDDGVQISAAPLWPLFRHKPWQKVLKDTWEKLKKGDYDWAHLAMNHWPERVREKCKTDKSLAIAHGLEDLYVEPEAAPKKARGRRAKEA